MRIWGDVLGALFCVAAMAAGAEVHSGGADMNWQAVLHERIALYGHRNWIVVADSAYPAQSRAGIETLVADATQQQVVETVLHELAAAPHVRPTVLLDKELEYLTDADVRGIEHYREQLGTLLPHGKATSLPHEEIIHKLDSAAETFRILIIKTNLTMPYTSVFLRLDCAYWGDDAEEKLRKRMAGR